MTFRISSLPPRDRLFDARDLVSAPPPGAPGTEKAAPNDSEGGAIVDLTSQAIRRSVAPHAQPAPVEDPAALAAKLQEQARRNPAQFGQKIGGFSPRCA